MFSSVLLLPLTLALLGPLGALATPPECGPCDPEQCAPLPEDGCAGGAVPDACGCCSVCAAAEGEPCGRRAGRCGAGMECARTGDDKKGKAGTCVCKSNYEVCGSDGNTYASGCALKKASLAALEEGKEAVEVKRKGRCESAPIIVTAPGQVYNVSGSQVFLSCEAVGVPTPVLTWRKVVSGRREELLPGDRDNLAVQTRGGPEKHEVTGWVLISPLTKEEEGSYECHATNDKGEATAVGAIYLVENEDEVAVKTVIKDGEL